MSCRAFLVARTPLKTWGGAAQQIAHTCPITSEQFDEHFVQWMCPRKTKCAPTSGNCTRLICTSIPTHVHLFRHIKQLTHSIRFGINVEIGVKLYKHNCTLCAPILIHEKDFKSTTQPNAAPTYFVSIRNVYAPCRPVPLHYAC